MKTCSFSPLVFDGNWQRQHRNLLFGKLLQFTFFPSFEGRIWGDNEGGHAGEESCLVEVVGGTVTSARTSVVQETTCPYDES